MHIATGLWSRMLIGWRKTIYKSEVFTRTKILYNGAINMIVWKATHEAS